MLPATTTLLAGPIFSARPRPLAVTRTTTRCGARAAGTTTTATVCFSTRAQNVSTRRKTMELPAPWLRCVSSRWRRGIQDVDYLTLAAAVDPAAVQQNRRPPGADRHLGIWGQRPGRPDLGPRRHQLAHRPRIGGRRPGGRWRKSLERPHALPFSIYLPTVLARPG
jgi:hypothetical protein